MSKEGQPKQQELPRARPPKWVALGARSEGGVWTVCTLEMEGDRVVSMKKRQTSGNRLIARQHALVIFEQEVLP